MSSQENSVSGLGGKYLTFRIGQEEYGVEVMKIREIIALMEITHVPKAPDFIRGVINLRGRIIPVVELRKKFGMPSIPDTARTCIIVADVMLGDHPVSIGLLVDSVSSVLDIEAKDIEPSPEYSANIHSEFILGMGKVSGQLKILLNIERVLSVEDMGAVHHAAAQAA